MSTRRTTNSGALRSQFNELTAVNAINNYATTGIAEGEKLLSDLRNSLASLKVDKYIEHINRDVINDNGKMVKSASSTDAPSQAKTVNAENIAFLERFQEYTRNLFISAEEIRTVIAVRVPEMKEEDNRGVIVQVALIKILDAFQTKLAGTGKGANSDDASSAAVGSTHSLCNMFAGKEYFTARREAEERILGKSKEDSKSQKENDNDADDNESGNGETGSDKGKAGKASSDDGDGKDKEGIKAPSAFYELYQIDRDIRIKMELSVMQILTSLRAIINSYEMNYKKLLQPRVVNESMVS